MGDGRDRVRRPDYPGTQSDPKCHQEVGQEQVTSTNLYDALTAEEGASELDAVYGEPCPPVWEQQRAWRRCEDDDGRSDDAEEEGSLSGGFSVISLTGGDYSNGTFTRTPTVTEVLPPSMLENYKRYKEIF